MRPKTLKCQECDKWPINYIYSGTRNQILKCECGKRSSAHPIENENEVIKDWNEKLERLSKK